MRSVTFADRLVDAWYAPRLTPLGRAAWPLSWLFRGVVAAPARAVSRAACCASSVCRCRSSSSATSPSAAPARRRWSQRACACSCARAASGRASSAAAMAAAMSSPRAVAAGDDPRHRRRRAAAARRRRVLPVWIGHDRAGAARGLLAANPGCDVIIADDGLQHYALARRCRDRRRRRRARPRQRPHAAGRAAARAAFRVLRDVDAIVRLVATRRCAQPPGDRRATYADDARAAAVAQPATSRTRQADPAEWRGAKSTRSPASAIRSASSTCVAALGIAATRHAFPDHHAFTAGDIDVPGCRARS